MLSLEEKRRWAEGMKEFCGKWAYFIVGTRTIGGKNISDILSPTFTTEQEAEAALKSLENPPNDARVVLECYLPRAAE